jgi:5-methylcytosine-specific restriction endonuclease McrA
MLDQYVFINLRKALVKKFRYKGLLRPKWVAHNFIGLGKNNPNNKAWQFRSLKYISKTKKWSYEYIWLLGDTFSRLCITNFLINRKTRLLSYYDNPYIFQDIMTKNISRRLVSDLKFKIYKEQNGLCLICKKPITEKSLLNRSTTVHLHHIVPRSVKKSLEITDKLYESRRNLTLLHSNCHLVLHKTTKINDSPYLRDEIPKHSITS